MPKEQTASTRGRTLYNIISVAVLTAVFVFVTLAVGPRLLATVREPEKFSAFIHENLPVGVAAFVGIQILQVFFALIPGEPIELFAGYAFGWLWGTLLCLVGCLIGSVLVFLLTRRFGSRFTCIAFAEDKLNSLKFMQNEKKLGLMTFLLFFIPGTPKDLLTYFVGLTKLSLKKFLLISGIARIPSVLTSALTGSSLMQQNYLASVLIFGITALVSLAGLALYKKISGIRSARQEAAEASLPPTAHENNNFTERLQENEDQK